MHYYLIHPNGSLEHHVMGQNLEKGETMALLVPGGVWKAVALEEKQEYGLITESVTPGFDYKDMKMASYEEMIQKFPQHAGVVDMLRERKMKSNELKEKLQ